MVVQISKKAIESYPVENAIKDTVKSFSIDLATFFEPPGKEFYRTLAYIASHIFGKTIIDIGTAKGAAALALSVNPTNQVITFDLQHQMVFRDTANISFEIADLWSAPIREYWKDTILDSALIFVDTEPHGGEKEYELYCWLKQNKYKGLLILDDISFFKTMRDHLWSRIPAEEKIDITSYSHWSGMGVVSFVPQPEFEWEVPGGFQTLPGTEPVRKPTRTIVTTFLRENATDKLDLTMASFTLSMPYPMIIYCEPDYVEKLREMRSRIPYPTEIREYTLEAHPFFKYCETIDKNRIENPYKGDKVSSKAYILSMTKYAFLKEAIDTNPFQTQYSMWMNWNMGSRGFDRKIFQHDTETLRILQLEYTPPVSDTSMVQYFQIVKTMFSSQCFSGSNATMYTVCNYVEELFLFSVYLGYGHLDEQLLTLAYYRDQEKFTPYYGEIASMFENMDTCKSDPKLIIQKSFETCNALKDPYSLFCVCKWLWLSYKKNPAILTREQILRILEKFMSACYSLGAPYIQQAKECEALFAFLGVPPS